MPLDDDIFKNATELQIVKKKYFQEDKEVLVQSYMKERTFMKLDSKKKNLNFLTLNRSFFYDFVNIHQPVMSIKEHSQRKPWPSSSGRKCSLLHLTTIFGNYRHEPLLNLQS